MESGLLDKGDIETVQGRGPPGQVWDRCPRLPEFILQ